jgi:predicted N-acetyltransferase YhbS
MRHVFWTGDESRELDKALDEKLTEHNLSRLKWDAPGEIFGLSFESEKEICAGLSFAVRGRWLHIRNLWVSEEHRSKGLGACLVRAVQKKCIEEGFEGVTVNTFSFQAPKFYERMGFVEDGRIPDRATSSHRVFFFWMPGPSEIHLVEDVETLESEKGASKDGPSVPNPFDLVALRKS